MTNFSQTETFPKPARIRKPRKVALKLSRFDKDVAKLIQSGVLRLENICVKLGVDAFEAQQRLSALTEKKLLVLDARTNEYRLGIDGYNKFAPKLKDPKGSKVKQEEPPVPEVRPVEKQPGLKIPERPLDVMAVLDESRKLMATKTFRPKIAPLERVDLGALLEKGAPDGKPIIKAGEMCDLCRSPFKLSLKEPGAAKFAHCVCGSAYHKDCYDSLIQQGGRCARCGRKLSSVLDASSEASLQDIKDAFE